MFKYSQKGISVFAVLDRRRAKLNGLYPVKIEVIDHRRQKYYPVGIDLSQTEWESIETGGVSVAIRRVVEESLMRVIGEVSRLVARDRFSFTRLDAGLGRPSGCTLNILLERAAEECRLAERANSFYIYRNILHGVEKFAGRPVCLSSVTPEWLYGCERFWIAGGKNATTVNIYMRGIRNVFNRAVSQGLVEADASPFRKDGYHIPKYTCRKLALDIGQIRKIAEFKGDAELEMWRDMWLFSYLCNGINFRDMLYLRYRNVVAGEIWYVRSKTCRCSRPKVIKAVITDRMRRIIDNIGNPYDGNPDTFIFRFASDGEDEFGIALNVRSVVNRCNIALGCIASQLGIPKFTTYSARHSFASILQRHGVDVSYISECLGHSSISVTESYLAGFGRDDREKYAVFLMDFEGEGNKADAIYSTMEQKPLKS